MPARLTVLVFTIVIIASAASAGNRYAGHSTIEELPHGGLLVRVGSDLFAAGKSSGTTRATGSDVRIEARCNDATYRDNSGSIAIHVLVVPVGR